MAITLVVVRGKYVYDDGTALTPAAGNITFTLQGTIQDPDTPQILTPKNIVATLDGTGSFSTKLAATDDPDVLPLGVTWSVQERIGDDHRTYSIAVPRLGGPIDLATVAPVAGSGGDFPFALVSYVDLAVAGAKATAVAMALVLGG